MPIKDSSVDNLVVRTYFGGLRRLMISQLLKGIPQKGIYVYTYFFCEILFCSQISLIFYIQTCFDMKNVMIF